MPTRLKSQWLIARSVSIFLSCTVLFLGCAMVFFPTGVVTFVMFPCLMIGHDDHDAAGQQHGNIMSATTTTTTFSRLLGAIIIAFSMFSLLTLLRFTMQNGITCVFSRESNSSRPEEEMTMVTLNHPSYVSSIEMEKCRMALVSHAILGLALVIAGLIDISDDEKNDDGVGDCGDKKSLPLLMGGSVLLLFASFGLMSSFFPVSVGVSNEESVVAVDQYCLLSNDDDDDVGDTQMV